MKRSAEKISVVLMIAVVLLFVFSCKFFQKNAGNTVPSNLNDVANTATPAPTYDGAKFKELLDKKDELAALSPPVKLDPKAIIKGKVFLAGNYKIGEDD